MPLEPLADKWRAFNWHVIEIDGHDFSAIDQAIEQSKTVFEKPTVIIAHTISGRGVSFMERNYKWHGMPPNPEQAEKALTELRAAAEQISKI